MDSGGGEVETCLQFAAFMQAVNVLWECSHEVSIWSSWQHLKLQLLCLGNLEIKGKKM